MKFIEKLDITADNELMNADLNNLLQIQDWPERTVINNKIYPANQLGITHRKNAENVWLDAGGNLYDQKLKQFVAKESDFTELNDAVGEYTKSVLHNLSEKLNIKFGRIRYMKLPMKQGLTIHRDFEARYHYVIKTNPNALFGESVSENDVVAKCYHLPADGHFYKVDTTRDHFVYNGGWEDRVHLVLCAI